MALEVNIYTPEYLFIWDLIGGGISPQERMQLRLRRRKLQVLMGFYFIKDDVDIKIASGD